MEIFRGDTFKFDFDATFQDGTKYTFKAGDTLKAGIKYDIKKSDYELYQKKTIEKDTETITFEFSHEEMMKVRVSNNSILEIELTDTSGRVSTLYQETIQIAGDVINE